MTTLSRGSDRSIQATRFVFACMVSRISLCRRAALNRYVAEAEATEGVTFIGRLGTYRYIDMDVAIREAMTAGAATLAALKAGAGMPAFFVKP